MDCNCEGYDLLARLCSVLWPCCVEWIVSLLQVCRKRPFDQADLPLSRTEAVKSVIGLSKRDLYCKDLLRQFKKLNLGCTQVPAVPVTHDLKIATYLVRCPCVRRWVDWVNRAINIYRVFFSACTVLGLYEKEREMQMHDQSSVIFWISNLMITRYSGHL